jgi:hypothetical protein
MKTQINGSRPEPVEQPDEKLKQMAEEVNQLQTEIASNDALSITYGKKTVELAISAGEHLIAIQNLLPHGKWEDWVGDNIKGITIQTCRNYMRLAESNRKHVFDLNDVETLRQAYIAARIIRPSCAKKQNAANKPPTPEELKNSTDAVDVAGYAERLNRARLLMVDRVRREIAGSVEWNLSEWTVRNDKLSSGDNENRWAQLLGRLREWVSFRNHGELTYQDEVSHKTDVVLCELVKSIISANCPPVVERTTSVEVSPSSRELNGEPVDAIQVITE